MQNNVSNGLALLNQGEKQSGKSVFSLSCIVIEIHWGKGAGKKLGEIAKASKGYEKIEWKIWSGNKTFNVLICKTYFHCEREDLIKPSLVSNFLCCQGWS